MNPFRKKSPADKEVRVDETVTQLAGTARVSVSPAAQNTVGVEDGESPGVPLDLWSDIAPVAIVSPTSPQRASTVGGEGADAILDLWADTAPAPVSNPAASPTSRASPASPPPSTKVTPRSPPPPVAPRRPRSQIINKRIPTPERTTTPEPVIDPFNPNPDTSSESDAEPPAASFAPRQVPRSMSPANPFLRASDGGVRRSLDMSDFSTTPGVPKPGRQSLDVDAFKRLMLTGQSTPTPTPQLDSSSTDTSSVSRQSIFEPILETETPETNPPETETPRTSHEIDDNNDDGGRSGRVRSASGGKARPKPPPPKPRSRGAPSGRSPITSTTTITIPTSPPPPPPPSSRVLRPLSQITPPPPPTLLSPTPTSPPQQSTSPTSPPTSPATSLRKRIPPSPPLSRRQSVHKPNPSNVELERPATPSGAKMKPPPPPMRRMKSVNSRPHERSLSINTMPPPPPPPPPPPGTVRSRSSTVSVVVEPQVPLVTSSTWPVQPEEGDILVDLQKLQREVDELRGKYEGRKDVGVAAGE